jgi:hypothetical protein
LNRYCVTRLHRKTVFRFNGVTIRDATLLLLSNKNPRICIRGKAHGLCRVKVERHSQRVNLAEKKLARSDGLEGLEMSGTTRSRNRAKEKTGLNQSL